MTDVDQRPAAAGGVAESLDPGRAPKPPATTRTKPRSTLRSVALPSEHGGWGLTLEPVLLGLLVAHSISALCIGLAAFLAFLARTPLKLAVVDARRGRTLDRTRMARKVAAVELVVLAALIVGAFLTATPGFWWPIVGIAPLLLLELSYDIRSRSRRLIPELAGAVGIAGVASMMALAGGLDTAVALGLWAVLAGRAIAAIPTIRSQVLKLHGRPTNAALPIVADLVALALVAAAAVVEPALIAGAAAVAVAIGAQRALIAWAPTERAVVLGIRQTVMGLAVVIATAVGVGLA